MISTIISLLSVSILPVLTGGSWLGSKTGQTIVNEQQNIKNNVDEAKNQVINYAILGVIAYFGYKYYVRKK